MLSPEGTSRVRELTGPLRSSDPSLSLPGACGLLLGFAPEPKHLAKPEVVWTRSWRCGSCGTRGRATGDGDATRRPCPSCGSGDLSFAPLQEQSE